MLEVKGIRGWAEIRPDGFGAQVLETEKLKLRGLGPLSECELGPVVARADQFGCLELSLASHPILGGHVGLLEIRDHGEVVGEIEIIADKLSADKFAMLRSELESVWLGLTFESSNSITRLSMKRIPEPLPSASDLWLRIEKVVQSIASSPHEQLVARPTVGRMERVRRPSGLTPAMLRAHHRGRAGPTTVLALSSDNSENAMVGETIRMLARAAERETGGEDLAIRLYRLSRNKPFSLSSPVPFSPTHGILRDSRYGQVYAVYRALSQRKKIIVEGPGPIRLGIRAIPRLWEYWVFLKVLEFASHHYGAPEGQGFEQLAEWTGPGKVRLEIPKGTEVEFPGNVVVAFEPEIRSNGRGWRGLELVPHPDLKRRSTLATPDVVVFKQGSEPQALVIDAKYVGRHFVELEASRVHEKYSRIRFQGQSIVENVLVVHPHWDLEEQWAGYGHLAIWPANQSFTLPLPKVKSKEVRTRVVSGVRVPGGIWWAEVSSEVIEICQHGLYWTDDDVAKAFVNELGARLDAHGLEAALLADMGDCFKSVLSEINPVPSGQKNMMLLSPLFDAGGLKMQGDFLFRSQEVP